MDTFNGHINGYVNSKIAGIKSMTYCVLCMLWIFRGYSQHIVYVKCCTFILLLVTLGLRRGNWN